MIDSTGLKSGRPIVECTYWESSKEEQKWRRRPNLLCCTMYCLIHSTLPEFGLSKIVFFKYIYWAI